MVEFLDSNAQQKWQDFQVDLAKNRHRSNLSCTIVTKNEWDFRCRPPQNQMTSRKPNIYKIEYSTKIIAQNRVFQFFFEYTSFYSNIWQNIIFEYSKKFRNRLFEQINFFRVTEFFSIIRQQIYSNTRKIFKMRVFEHFFRVSEF